MPIVVYLGAALSDQGWGDTGVQISYGTLGPAEQYKDRQ